MDQKEAKEKVAKLVNKYEQVLKAGKVKKYSEEETKKEFILPLFKALGWDVDSKEEVSAEEHVKSSGLADYGFYINGRAKFYLEAKAFKADLYKEEFARQAIRYSFNKVVTWAVLTDFENLKVFNANAISDHLGDKQFFDIPYTEYLKRFDQLWLLSREAFKKDLLDIEATKAGKMLQKVSVTDKLYEDLNKCRELLTKSLSQWNPKVPNDLLDEGVQKLLDRLIFIRVAEDRNVEPPTLKVLIREWKNRKTNDTDLYQSMVNKFRELDAIYDSNLFSKHPFEKWEEYDEATEKVINILYGKEGYYDYDFKYIPADVLGNIYENYLGYQLLKSAKGLTTSKDAKKRKEQGIYYTPTYIVDYIVTNALKPVLDKCDSVAELKQIRVLDPACGSGSFLLKAMEVINDKYKEFGYKGDEYTKIQILTENIYGVDLDEKAVEIAQLNLLINSLDKQMKLPNLAKNIKNGNSLISGTDQELEKAFGKDYRDKKPFNWQEEFPEVLNRKNPGFDVIIGNPPYIKEFVNKSAFDGLRSSPYYQGKMDLWTMFACIGIDLLRDKGTMSFIAPNNWVSNAGASIFRDKLLNEGELKSFIDFGDYKVFDQAGIQTMVYVFKKHKPEDRYEVDYLRVANKNIDENKLIDEMLHTSQVKIEPNNLIGKNITFSTSENAYILDKLEAKKNFELNAKEVGQGIVAPQESVIRSHLPTVPSATLGEGIFVLSDEEVQRMTLSKDEKKILKPYYTSKKIDRYCAQPENDSWVIYMGSNAAKEISRYPELKAHLDRFKDAITSAFGPYGLHRAREEAFFIGPSIFSLRKTNIPRFSYVDFPCYVSQTYFIIHTERANLKYLTAIFNSNLTTFWLRNRGKLQGDMLQIDKEPLLKIPIYIGSTIEQKSVISKVDKMISLYKELDNTPKNSNKWHKLNSEIEKTDKKIDQLVYKLYSLTPEEIKIIEEFRS